MKTLHSRFGRSRHGNVAMIVALSAVPLVGGVGLAVDSGAAARRSQQLQSAVDSGVLAALKALPTEDDAGVTAAAKRYIDTNFGGRAYTLTAVEIDRAASRVEIEASSPHKTAFGGLFGVAVMNVKASATAVGGGSVELVMALDNSGSMAEAGRMPALKDASERLVDTLMDDTNLAARVKVGVVPFSTAVNVGPAYGTAAWIDRTGQSPVHAENFDKPDVSRFALFSALGTPWSGCVEARPTSLDLDVEDTAPTGGDGRTLFVPMFAPDEPDQGAYGNSYLDDDKGACTKADRGGSNAERQARTCKYVDQKPKARGPSGAGPNAKCESIPLLPLTGDKAAVTAKLQAMRPSGNTNIIEGAAWGWRLLSKAAPFTEGAPADQTGNRKIMIVMTDGENTMSGTTANHNLSAYSAYGYSAKQRLLSPGTGEERRIRAAMNARLRLACNNAKSAGVEIFSIIVSPPNAEARQVMEDCASPAEPTQHAFAPSSAGELQDVFDQIGKSITQVRLAR